MSQFFINSAGSTPPPTVATSYILDDGTAIPELNILNVNAIDSIENNNNGIFTRANPNLSNNAEIILTNRILVTATTSDGGGQTQNIILMSPTDETAVTFKCGFIGYDSTNNQAAGGSQEGIARKSAGVATVVGVNDSSDQSDAGLVAVDWNVIAIGANLVAQFVGVAGRTITWTACFTYNQTP